MRCHLSKSLFAVFIVVTVAVIPALAQNFAAIASFDGTNGGAPQGDLIQGTNGSFYGTTLYNGANGGGTVFKISTAGKLKTIYNFCTQPGCADGQTATAGLVQAPDGKFYGTTQFGGAHNAGTVFQVTAAGKLANLYNFCSQVNCTDGAYPVGSLVQGADGNLYGASNAGGITGGACGSNGCGTIFKITSAGMLTTLYAFCSKPNCTDGEIPVAGLVQGTDGNFYGTTAYSSNTSPSGTVFAITPAGKLTTLYQFCSQSNCADGSAPFGRLVQGVDGNFYGTTSQSGMPNCGVFGLGCGTVFKITPKGALTTLHTFDGTDGAYEWAGLAQGTDGNFYGATYYGGLLSCTGGCGTIYKITSSGVLTTLYEFCSQTNCPDGDEPISSLMQSTNGNFYGTTYTGGTENFTCTFGCGTVFRLGMGLGPFVETEPTSGKVGTKVVILGNSLKGATSVSFNGTAATFKASATQIKTTVPSGATTGTVTVVTPSGTLKSNVAFRVTP
jgi:uncharacterized repeat protein (TIGR03803 family)